jgi:hypothetical protein
MSIDRRNNFCGIANRLTIDRNDYIVDLQISTIGRSTWHD